ncbi:leucine-rich repeat-containing protein 70-like [Lepisosteus oculatus]|uniref:leucine-rich repeat-containing protein 70-like n=1 Tax=Lepisosteus oculatus TaxID=7918 RepID=UPI0037113F14
MLRIICSMNLLKTVAKPGFGFLFLLLCEYSLSCPPVCQQCSVTRVQCYGLGLTSIPRNLPHSTATAYLSRNNISHVCVEDLRRLKNLSVLFLDHNGLEYIKPRAMKQLYKLSYLYLNNNHIGHLDMGTLKGLSSLRYLYLQHNKLTSLPQRIFNDLVALRSLHLQGNSLQTLGSGTFSNLINLNSLNLAENKFSTISSPVFTGLGRLHFLYLQGNNLSHIPAGAFSELGNLKRLDLSRNPIGLVTSFTFQGLENLQYLLLISAQIRSIAQNGFAGLSRLRQLTLSHNCLKSISPHSFSLLRQLKYLHLDANDITHIGAEAFEGMATSLSFLNLKKNKLKYIHPEVLKPLSPFIHVHVARNPWNCSCALLGLHEWLMTSSIRMNLHCQSPFHLKGRLLHHLKRYEFGTCCFQNGTTTSTPLWPPGSWTGRGKTFSCKDTLVLTTSVLQDIPYKYQPQTTQIADTMKKTIDEAVRITETAQSSTVLLQEVPYKYQPQTTQVADTTTRSPEDDVGITETAQLSIVVHYKEQEPPHPLPGNLTSLSGERPQGAEVSLSVKPSQICEQSLDKLNQAFDTLLAFLIIACVLVLALLYKVLELRHKLRVANGMNALEYFSICHSGHYSVREPSPSSVPILSLPPPPPVTPPPTVAPPPPPPMPVPPPPQPVTGSDLAVYTRIGQVRTMKQYNGNRTQVILFEHSVL